MPLPSPAHLDPEERAALHEAAAHQGVLRLAALDLLTRGADGTPRLTRLGQIMAQQS